MLIRIKYTTKDCEPMYRPRRIEQVTEAQKVEDESVNQSAKQIKVEGESGIQSAKFRPKGRRNSVAQNANIRSSISSNKATYESSNSTACGGKSCQEYSLPLIHNDNDNPMRSRLLVLQTSELISLKKCYRYSKSNSPSLSNINNENNKENINAEADKQNDDLAASMQPVKKKDTQCLSPYQKEDSDSTASKQTSNIPESKKYTIINSNIDTSANSDILVQSLPSPSSQEQIRNSSEDIDLNENTNKNLKMSEETPTSLIHRGSILDQYLLSFHESFFLDSSSSFPSEIQVSNEIRSERKNNSFWFSSLSNLTSLQLQSNAVNEPLLVPKSTAVPDKSPTIVTKDMIQLCSPSSNTMCFSNHLRRIDNDNASSSISHLSFSDSSFSESVTFPSPEIKAITTKANDILNKYKKIT